MHMSLPVLIISMLLFFVLFFGIGFILNMLLRMTWLMAIIYPIVAILIIDKVRFLEYFTNSRYAFQQLGERISSLLAPDILILISGFLGALVAGIVMKILRQKGYRMF
ncbi:YuiB family protein [Heyndrickxia sp. NPDC080065]|uniref:YuiB family protein n=1 Tax=Heyndrickxia sp. NPDC080065 TaxID=3390568 RepID=UPI003D05C044